MIALFVYVAGMLFLLYRLDRRMAAATAAREAAFLREGFRA